MTIRKLKPAEIETSLRMSEFAFQIDISEEERKERKETMNPEETWVVEDGGDIVSKATILPLHVYFNGQIIPMGGVSGVATWPEYRRGGHVTKLLSHSLAEMKKDGQILSFLYPFSIPFYRKYGWELFADTESITLSKEQLPRREKFEGMIRRISSDDGPEIIDEIYHAWAKKYSGTLVRDAEWWQQSVLRRKKGTIVAYFNASKEKTGYLIYEVKNRKMSVHEIIWLTPDARKALFHFISNHDSMVDSVEIKTVAHECLPFLLEDPKVKREVSSYFMARLVDVKAFLIAYSFKIPSGSQPIILHVSDEFCSWNNGTYIVSPSKSTPEKHEVQFFEANQLSKDNKSCAHSPKRGLHLSVQHLTALLFCIHPVHTLYEEGLIEGDEQTKIALEASIPSIKPFIYDFF